jgi:hypothetical protein
MGPGTKLSASKLERVHDLLRAVHCRRNLSQGNPFAALDGLRRVSERWRKRLSGHLRVLEVPSLVRTNSCPLGFNAGMNGGGRATDSHDTG